MIPGDFNATSTSVCTGLASFFQALFARIMAGMHEEDSYAVFSGDDSDPVSSRKYSGTLVFTAPVAEPIVCRSQSLWLVGPSLPLRLL